VKTTKSYQAYLKREKEKATVPTIDVSKVTEGVVSAKYRNAKQLRVLIVKGEDKRYYYLKGNEKYHKISLHYGTGTYKISIMKNIQDKSYEYVLTNEITMKTEKANQAYLASAELMNWDNSMISIKKAKSLSVGLSDSEKVSAIYEYVISNIKYNKSIKSLPQGYSADIESAYHTKLGVCYDFASLYGLMLRSVGIPTKLVKGTAINVSGYHAWNEVYVDGSWRTIDTSSDSQMKALGLSTTMYKFSGYITESEY